MSDYNELIGRLDVGIETASSKLESGRITDTEREDIRLEYLSRLNQLVRTKADLIHQRSEAADG